VLLDEKELPSEAKRIGIISARFDDQAIALFQAKKQAAKVDADVILQVKALETTGEARKRKQRYGY
jgi:hypothetical protein